MQRYFQFESWVDDGWYVGKLKDVPGVFSQAETLEELEQNIQEAYHLMLAEGEIMSHTEIRTKELAV